MSVFEVKFSEIRASLPLWFMSFSPLWGSVWGCEVPFLWPQCWGHVLDQVLCSLTQRLKQMMMWPLHRGPDPPGLWLQLFLESSLHFPTETHRKTFNYPPHSALLANRLLTFETHHLPSNVPSLMETHQAFLSEKHQQMGKVQLLQGRSCAHIWSDFKTWAFWKGVVINWSIS